MAMGVPAGFTTLDPVNVFLCATMWHETYDEMMKMVISIFRSYLYYLLGWKVATKYYKRSGKGGDKEELKKEFQKEKNNTYLLALDGDTDFQPAAVMLLIDRLKTYPENASGQPVAGFTPLDQTAEHVIGSVLCSPGCFSLFRASALMDNNVMKKYTIKSSKARDYIQYDQGEDRWLCTLLMKQGWRVEYNAASDSYTNAPEDFKEFYNQRRRWGPSTMANIVDLLGSTTMTIKKNPSMSKPYMLYQLLVLGSSILAPATVVLMIEGTLSVLLDVHPNAALVMAVIPPAIFLGISFKIKSDTQIRIAAVMSTLYAFLMMISGLTIIANILKDQTILTPSSIFLISLALFYIITAIMHPKEIGLVCFGLLYIICIPSAYLLLAIYSMVNMNNVSWGTRETAPAADTTKAAIPQTKAQKAKSTVSRWFSQAKCSRKLCRRGSAEENILSQEEIVGPETQPQNSIVEDVRIPEEEQRDDPAFICPNQSWVAQLQSVSDDMRLQEDMLDKEEEQFFIDLTAKYLEPLPENKKKQEQMANELKELRNKMTFVYFICNALWLLATFTLQLVENTLFIQVPKINLNLEYTGEYISIDPVSFMFILAFIFLNIHPDPLCGLPGYRA
ncbi:hypothetical protein NQZ68_036256 [Dissostichus eleginoides]|nr:hypothetical protein NQZ68_036256 [Dissostichus eleginoides]